MSFKSSVDIKFKSDLWATSNTTEKIEFVSQVVQIFEPETFRFKPRPDIEFGRRQCIGREYRTVQVEPLKKFKFWKP